MSENNFRSQFLPFQIDTQLFFLLKFLDKMTMSVIKLVRDIWMNNACVKLEERSLNPSKVIALTTKRGGGGAAARRRGGAAARRRGGAAAAALVTKT